MDNYNNQTNMGEMGENQFEDFDFENLFIS